MSPSAHASITRGAPYFLVPDVAVAGTYYQEILGFHAEYAAGEPPECRGATFVYSPTVRPYGMREFAVRDPNGYVLGFGQECSTSTSS